MSSRIIIGISGASGVVYAIRLLEMLRELRWETHLVITRTGARTITEETPYTVAQVRELATYDYNIADFGAPIASGSFQTAGMIVAPCAIRSAAEIAYGTTSNLLTRAADVVLKERRRLVLLVRETPLHTGHLRMMTQLSEIGAIVAPPVPAFYCRPKTLDDMVDQTAGRALDLFGLTSERVRRWPEKLPSAD